jgi:hypothetical protein
MSLLVGHLANTNLSFGTSKDFETSTVLPQSDGSSSIIPREFWAAAVKDLNGGFGNRYNCDAAGAVISHGECLKSDTRFVFLTMESARYLELLQD